MKAATKTITNKLSSIAEGIKECAKLIDHVVYSGNL